MIGAPQIMREEEQEHQGDTGKNQDKDGQKARHRLCRILLSSNVEWTIIPPYAAFIRKDLGGGFPAWSGHTPEYSGKSNSRLGAAGGKFLVQVGNIALTAEWDEDARTNGKDLIWPIRIGHILFKTEAQPAGWILIQRRRRQVDTNPEPCGVNTEAKQAVARRVDRVE